MGQRETRHYRDARMALFARCMPVVFRMPKRIWTRISSHLAYWNNLLLAIREV